MTGRPDDGVHVGTPAYCIPFVDHRPEYGDENTPHKSDTIVSGTYNSPSQMYDGATILITWMGKNYDYIMISRWVSLSEHRWVHYF